MAGVVSVGCKLPNGCHLNVFRMVDSMEVVQGNGLKEIKRAEFAGRVTLRGTKRTVDDPRVQFGAAFTHGVDADFWAAWLDANKDSDLVKNGIVFAHAKQEEVRAMARDHVTLRTGQEPVDPDNLPAEFKRKIKTADSL